MKNITLGILGAGNMATAIINGILKSKVLAPNSILVSDIDVDKLSALKKLGVSTTTDNNILFEKSNYIILAIKPQVAKNILPQYKNSGFCKNFISIMAGITKQNIIDMLGDIKVTRIMPNTPCLVGCGMCAIDSTDFDKNGQDLVYNIFSSLGKVINLSENYFHAVTAVSGSGPAYVYMFIDAMIKGGVKFGLDYETSKTLALQTFNGSSKMVENSNDIDKLIKNVCSPGGTTIQAVDYYNEQNIEDIIVNGMEKCKNRSEELGKNA